MNIGGRELFVPRLQKLVMFETQIPLDMFI